MWDKYVNFLGMKQPGVDIVWVENWNRAQFHAVLYRGQGTIYLHYTSLKLLSTENSRVLLLQKKIPLHQFYYLPILHIPCIILLGILIFSILIKKNSIGATRQPCILYIIHISTSSLKIFFEFPIYRRSLRVLWSKPVTVGWGTMAQCFCPPYLKAWFFYV